MAVQLSQQELSETLERAKEIADQTRDPLETDAEIQSYVQAAQEMGVPPEAMRLALQERMLVHREELKVGQRVFAPSIDGFWYIAELVSTDEHRATVRFLTGSDHTCPIADLRPLSLLPGRKVQADCKDWNWYNCKILLWDKEKDRIEVIHDDWAPQKEWVTPAKIRLSRQHVFPQEQGKHAEAQAKIKATIRRWAWLAAAGGTTVGFILARLLTDLLPFIGR